MQDGGAVLGFSYHDVMARLRVNGPDDAARRLFEILAWFDDVQRAGGYRKYYDGSRDGTLQGCGTPGGLGVDCEFFESVMVPQVMIDGFLGLAPEFDRVEIHPRLPSDWPSLTIAPIRVHGRIIAVTATHDSITVEDRGGTGPALEVESPFGSGIVAPGGKLALAKR